MIILSSKILGYTVYVHSLLYFFQLFEDYLCESVLPPLDSKTEEGYVATSNYYIVCLHQCS